ncbi:NAD-dependent epimerase/dehydratase family protein [Acidomonas methanolica]|uniref:UDP-N-acetylglucosamine 4-epimerase n=1 Tax=Acidomonas methanolica NBRC 104435 TaxID=1231351 RepID=A0A023D8D4_ACIMT|nr:NAD-dependent epimerase/dehydratase family protein [Acidomonas methanolica]MBU2654989.1 GDP-mannose 4,6-dehydratase [Acidomonas methanolica]TCS26340.1 UDP-glucuronate 4-epimerase [Acidomonas methanolica]GAJ30398.1 UDP-N-acetylglucosamine 4-epimerase [Acidomonas methanolica NBRC 104435]GBQ51951.1 UDP-N-acetylglucosamine 4-epimerase [Acidomonas methanolica]GEK99129.1 NAD-dependent epimerase [Acidomonas methanolica NBRC 104435]
MTVLVTGAAGFVGYHVAESLLAAGHDVLGVDNLNDYYDPALKEARLARLAPRTGFTFRRLDLSDTAGVAALFEERREISHIVHLAAQAGVRHSLLDPCAYVTANVMAHVVLLEAARALPHLKHVVYASSSSVYGLNATLPFRESDAVDQPSSLYAVTKRTGELTAHAYAHLYGVPQTGLRFFTAYGPWGRPDMAYYHFAQAIATGELLTLYEGDGLVRDFTYVDDIVRGIVGVLDLPPQQARILNLGSDNPAPVRRLIALLESELGRVARIQEKPRPRADVEATWSDVSAIEALTGWKPQVSLEEGVARFVAWFRAYHEVG